MEHISFNEKDPNADFPKAIKNAFEKYNSSKYKEAIVDLNKAIKLQPKYAPAYNLRGLCKAGLNDFKASILDYDKAIKLKHDYAAAYMNRGDSNAHLKRNKKSFEDYLEVTKIDPKNDTAFFYCGIQKVAMRYAESDWDSIDYFSYAINLNSKNSEYYLHRGMSYINIYNGVIYDTFSDREDFKRKAESDWKKAYKLGSKTAQKLLNKYKNVKYTARGIKVDYWKDVKRQNQNKGCMLMLIILLIPTIIFFTFK